MRVGLFCVGRLKQGAERDLFDRYWGRARTAGKPVGLTFHLDEITESRARSTAERKREEAAMLVSLMPPGTHIVVFDEGGGTLTSAALAQSLAALRDQGTGDLAAVIGGPDGISPDLLARAHQTISFGAMTWPHQLARVLAAEQFYRVTTILSGHPYHRA